MQENKKLRKARISDLLRMKINGKRGRVLCHNKEESTREKTTCDQADAKSCCSTCKGASEQVARGATGAIILEVQRRVTYMRGIVMSLNQTLYKNIFRDGFFFFFSLTKEMCSASMRWLSQMKSLAYNSVCINSGGASWPTSTNGIKVLF